MENLRTGAVVLTDPNDTDNQVLKRRKLKSGDTDTIEIFMKNKNKHGELIQSGSLFVSFCIVPFEAAELIPVGQGRSDPNVDPFLPEPAGRLSLMSGPWASLLGGFFVISGSLKQ